MADLFSRKAKFDQIKYVPEALTFHASRYENGSVDALAKQAFQYLQQIRKQQNNVENNTKP